MTLRIVASLCLILATVSTRAYVTDVFVHVTPGAVVPGTVTNDLRIAFHGELRTQQLLVRLLQGTIYHTPLIGNDAPPAPAFIGLVPELEYDTFVALGGLTQTTSEFVFFLGGAVDLSGDPTLDMRSTDRLNVAWAPAPGTTISANDFYPIARLTFSEDASGIATYLGMTSTGIPFRQQIAINYGVVPINQPLPGDFNYDSRVDNADLSLLLGAWGESDVPDAWYYNFNGPIVDDGELADLLTYWGDEGFAPFAVPEPAGVALVLTLTVYGFVQTRSGDR